MSVQRSRKFRNQEVSLFIKPSHAVIPEQTKSIQPFPPYLHSRLSQSSRTISILLYLSDHQFSSIFTICSSLSLSLSPPWTSGGGLLDERLRLEKSHRARRSQPSIFLPVIPPFTLSCSPPLSLPPCLFSIYVCPSPTRPSLIPFSGEAGQV